MFILHHPVRGRATRRSRRFAGIAALLTSLGSGLGPGLHAQTPGQQTYCNPVDINYQYNFEQRARNISYRSGADPVIVRFGDEYFLFATISGGWWHGPDLIHWEFVKPNIWPKEDMCAPAVEVVGDTLYLFQSTFEQRPIYATKTPATGQLMLFNPLLPPMPGAAGPWDPALFRDPDTGRWYMYFGSSNVYPLYGIELDPARQLTYIGTAREMIALRPELHGWERFGRDHRYDIKPFIEGAWMTKHNGRYYLQYAGPGTEYNVYANGTYVGDQPLGPFTYAPNNPIAYKPGGFVTGAGHGNTFQDRHGNFWNTGTPWIAVNFDFERRIALFPAGFDRDGWLHADTRFGDFPRRMPTGRWENTEETFTGWMLLSYRKPASASSSLALRPAANVTDENPRTYWVAGANRPGEWLEVDLEHPCDLNAAQVNFTDYKAGLFASDTNVYTQFRLLVSTDRQQWTTVADLTGERRDRPNAYLEFARPVRARYVRYEHVYVGGPHVAISDLRVFGRGPGEVPATPARLAVRRDNDARNGFVNWEDVPGAVGYNIRWGLRPDKLYQTYQVFADERPALEIRALNVGQDYYFAIEAFGEAGVSRLSDAVHLE